VRGRRWARAVTIDETSARRSFASRHRSPSGTPRASVSTFRSP